MVTIVIPVYNREDYLRDAIESVIRQTCSDWRLVVVDDASDDDTPSVVSSYLHDKRIIYVRQDENGGVSQALNRGLELVQTNFFLQVDSDDWLEKDALEQLTVHAASKPESTALFYGNWWSWKKRKGQWRKRLRKPQPIHSAYECTYKRMVRPRFYRTAALRAVDGWSTDDPYGGRYMEDRQMMIKLQEAGFTFHYIDYVLYNLRRHGGNQSSHKNLHPYRQVKAWLYPQLVERWGQDQYRLEIGDKVTIVRLGKESGEKEEHHQYQSENGFTEAAWWKKIRSRGRR
jgi:glycosyltransferase involved in cell wall biosynthesis